jgi:hypothetical protein
LCGYSIPPNELQRTDFTHVRCPKCLKEFVPGKGWHVGITDVHASECY